jgi:hypothetical protein
VTVDTSCSVRAFIDLAQSVSTDVAFATIVWEAGPGRQHLFSPDKSDASR